MSILKVSRMGHPVLRQPTQEISPEQIKHPALQKLIDDMIETMIDEEGIGLAAPQVFQPLRLVIFGDPEPDPEDEEAIPLTVLINPHWLEQSEEKAEAWEGCLSVPGMRGVVPRSTSVTLEALDREGECVELHAEDMFARVLQHEIDHLDGVLYLDRMTDMRRLAFMEEFQRYWQHREEPGEE
jgi:peptide deformylase